MLADQPSPVQSRRMSTVRSSLLLLLFVLALSGCRQPRVDEKDADQPGPSPSAVEGDAASSDDEEEDAGEVADAPPPDAPARCAAKAPGVALGEPGRAVLLGDAVALGPHRYVVPYLTGSSPERAALALVTFEGAATVRSFDLGEVHGQVEPPLVVGSRSQAERVFVVVGDNDATSATLRVATVKLDDGTVTSGPTARAGRGESMGASLAATSSGLLLVWDRVESALSRSGIFALTAPNASPEIRHGEERRVTPLSMDIDAPRLVPAGDDFWLAGVRYEEPKSARGAGQADALGLVEEPPRELVVARADRLGKITSDFVVIDRLERGELVFDAAPLSGGRLLIAHAGDQSEVLALTTLGPDGVPATERFAAPPATQGVPSLLGASDVRLLAIGAGTGTQLGLLDADGRLVGALGPDRGLGGALPLAVWGAELLVTRPRGASVELAELTCGWAASGASKQKSAP